MKSVFYVKTERVNSAGQPEMTPVFLDEDGVHGKHVFDRKTGSIMKINSGDTIQTASGYQIAIDTLTYIVKTVSDQKFYKIPFADFVPVNVGDGAFAQDLLTNRTYSYGDDFESGIINQGESARLANVVSGVDGIHSKVINWAKALGYNIFQVEQALVANNWDYIAGIHKALKTNWDLGLQEVAFLGSKKDAGVKGLLTADYGANNTTVITKAISAMTAEEFSVLVRDLVSAYWAKSANTEVPDTFLIPSSDFFGLQTPTSSSFPIANKLEYLEKALKGATGNENFKIRHTAYAEASKNTSRGLNKQVYMLYRYDPESIRMNVPVQYQVTQAGTQDNFSFGQIAYGQYTGVTVLRQNEVLRFVY